MCIRDRVFGAYLAGGSVHAHFAAVVDAGHRGVFEQLHAQRLGGSGFAKRQVEWVQMARAHVDHGAVIIVGARCV